MRNIIILLIMSFGSVVLADGFKSKDETREFSDELIGYFIKKEFKEGLDSAKPYWPHPDVEIDGLTNTILQQWPIVDQRFGESVGKEFIKEERIGKSFHRYYYLHKFENHSIYFCDAFQFRFAAVNA